jgi:hypothetical protein
LIAEAIIALMHCNVIGSIRRPDCSRVAALSKLHIDANSWENLGDEFVDRTGSAQVLLTPAIVPLNIPFQVASPHRYVV